VLVIRAIIKFKLRCKLKRPDKTCSRNNQVRIASLQKPTNMKKTKVKLILQWKTLVLPPKSAFHSLLTTTLFLIHAALATALSRLLLLPSQTINYSKTN